MAIRVLILAVLLTGGAVFVGGPAAIGYLFEQQVRAEMEKLGRVPGLKVSVENYEQRVFSSRALVSLAFANPSVSVKDSQHLNMELVFHFTHGPRKARPFWLHGQGHLRFGERWASTAERYIGANRMAEFNYRKRLDGINELELDIFTAELPNEQRTRSHRLDFAGGSGSIRWTDSSFDASLYIPDLILRENNHLVEARDFFLNASGKQGEQWLWRANLLAGAERLYVVRYIREPFYMDNGHLSWAVDPQISRNQLDVRVNHRADAVGIGKYGFRNGQFKFRINNLRKKLLRKLYSDVRGGFGQKDFVQRVWQSVQRYSPNTHIRHHFGLNLERLSYDVPGGAVELEGAMGWWRDNGRAPERWQDFSFLSASLEAPMPVWTAASSDRLARCLPAKNTSADIDTVGTDSGELLRQKGWLKNRSEYAFGGVRYRAGEMTITHDAVPEETRAGSLDCVRFLPAFFRDLARQGGF